MGKVSLVLLADVKGSGKKGEIVSVAEGYARNCLLPMKLAKIADNSALAELDMQKKAEAKRQENELKKAEEIKNIIDEKSVDIYASGGKNGKLFGSITAKDVADAIKQKFSVEIDKRKIKLNVDGLKSVDSFGTYGYEIKIYARVIANIRVNVKEKVGNTEK